MNNWTICGPTSREYPKPLARTGGRCQKVVWHAKPWTFLEWNTIEPHRHTIGTIINDLERVVIHYLQNTCVFRSSLWNCDKDSSISGPSVADFSRLFIYIFILFSYAVVSFYSHSLLKPEVWHKSYLSCLLVRLSLSMYNGLQVRPKS